MAKLLEFNKNNEDDLFAHYKVESDNFNADLTIDKIYQEITLVFTSTSKYLNDAEITDLKQEFVKWVINKKLII